MAARVRQTYPEASASLGVLFGFFGSARDTSESIEIECSSDTSTLLVGERLDIRLASLQAGPTAEKASTRGMVQSPGPEVGRMIPSPRRDVRAIGYLPLVQLAIRTA